MLQILQICSVAQIKIGKNDNLHRKQTNLITHD